MKGLFLSLMGYALMAMLEVEGAIQGEFAFPPFPALLGKKRKKPNEERRKNEEKETHSHLLVPFSSWTVAGLSHISWTCLQQNPVETDRTEPKFPVTTNTLPQTNSSSTSGSQSSRLIPILVGGNSLTYTPNSVTARPGDVLQFQFGARNHTVTQSAQDTPCQPGGGGGSGGAGGLHSGFIPFDGGAGGTVGTFDVPVLDDKPMFLYCAQAQHCQQGMVMLVNG